MIEVTTTTEAVFRVPLDEPIVTNKANLPGFRSVVVPAVTVKITVNGEGVPRVTVSAAGDCTYATKEGKASNAKAGGYRAHLNLTDLPVRERDEVEHLIDRVAVPALLEGARAVAKMGEEGQGLTYPAPRARQFVGA